MYKATHNYVASADHVLSLTKGESVCVLEKSNEAWWLVLNAQGKVGYVPINFVEKEKDDSDVVLQSVNNAIEEILASAPEGCPQPQQQTVLKKLMTYKETLVTDIKKKKQNSSKRRAPAPPASPARGTPPPIPQRAASLQPSYPAVAEKNEEHINESISSSKIAPSKPQNVDNEVDLPFSGSIPDHIPEDIGTNLLDILKTTLNPNEEKCRYADKLSDDLLSLPTLNETTSKLSLALENIREIKNDAQQRNWAIEDDEDKIIEILNDILSELTSLNGECSISALTSDHNLPIHTLVEYHQMETRVSLRLVILQIFGAICSLSKSVVSTLLLTVLPVELAMDVMMHTQDAQRTGYSALVMSMLFSTAEPIPIGHYDRLNKSFVQFLIKYIEGDAEGSEQDDQVSEMFLNVLLSFNLHMLIPSENIIMQAIADRETCTIFGEKIMILVNRGDDPVVMEEHWTDNGDRPPHSVIKFLQDVYSQPTTSTFLYTNDMNVLIDITVRNLTDLQSGNKLRTEYLELLLNVLKNSDYADNRHRCADIGQSLNRILSEEPPDDKEEQDVLDFDKRMVEMILGDFGYLFL